MRFFKSFIKRRTNHEFKTIELYYSIFYGRNKWFCRVWKGFYYSESYGYNKFNAYRKAVKGIFK